MDIITLFFTISVPVVIGLIAFAYKAPKAYRVVQRDIVKYVFWGWWLVIFVIMTFWLLDKNELVIVSFFSDDFMGLLDDASGPDLLLIILSLPLLVWFSLALIGKVSKYSKGADNRL